MRTRIVAIITTALTSALLAPITFAGVVDCAALTAAQRRQAETIGACGVDTPKSLCLPATDEGLLALIDLLAVEANYQTTIGCAAVRVVDELGILTTAGPGDGACTVELAGTAIANPQPRRQVALRWWRWQLNERIAERAAEAAARVERERVLTTTTEPLPADSGDQ